MPQMYFHVEWPDNEAEACYSPSSVIKKYFTAGQSYPLNDFVQIAEDALNEASERVNEVYGYYCTSAMDQLLAIKTKSQQYQGNENPIVIVTKITDRIEN